MTAAERLMIRGQFRAERDWATTGSFTLDGVVGTWRGVVSDEASVMTLALGGSVTERAIIITANRQQFDDASATPVFGQSVVYNGQRWVIEQIPGLNSDQTNYEFRCVGQMNKRAKR
jgi:hypothetical protein